MEFSISFDTVKSPLEFSVKFDTDKRPMKISVKFDSVTETNGIYCQV